MDPAGLQRSDFRPSKHVTLRQSVSRRNSNSAGNPGDSYRPIWKDHPQTSARISRVAAADLRRRPIAHALGRAAARMLVVGFQLSVVFQSALPR